MFTKQKQEVKGVVQFMGEGKQLGRCFDLPEEWECDAFKHSIIANYTMM